MKALQEPLLAAQEPGLTGGGTDQARRCGLSWASGGGDFDLDRLALTDLRRARQGQYSLRPLAKVEECEPQPAIDPPHPGHGPYARRRLGRLAIPLDPEAFGQAIQEDHRPPLAGAVVQEEPAMTGHRRPSPSSRRSVSYRGRPTTAE